jgi:hypothetical protein
MSRTFTLDKALSFVIYNAIEVTIVNMELDLQDRPELLHKFL